MNNLMGIDMKAPLGLQFDPPPDLVIEIVLTNSSVEKMAIYAALKEEHPNFAKIKFVVGASRSLLLASEQDARTTKKSIYTFGMLPIKNT